MPVTTSVLFLSCMFLQLIYHPIYALFDNPFMIYIKYYMFRHQGAFLIELLQQRCKPIRWFIYLCYNDFLRKAS